MEKTVITFNDLPEIVAQLRDEVMSLRSLLTEQRSVNNARAVDTHVPKLSHNLREVVECNHCFFHLRTRLFCKAWRKGLE